MCAGRSQRKSAPGVWANAAGVETMTHADDSCFLDGLPAPDRIKTTIPHPCMCRVKWRLSRSWLRVHRIGSARRWEWSATFSNKTPTSRRATQRPRRRQRRCRACTGAVPSSGSLPCHSSIRSVPQYFCAIDGMFGTSRIARRPIRVGTAPTCAKG